MSKLLLEKLDSWKYAMGEFAFRNLLIETFDKIEVDDSDELLPALDSDLLFKVFENINIDDIKVVIVGMDIYHDGSYIGRAFGNKVGGKVSPSLRNILKEVNRTHTVSKDTEIDLKAWEDQGVLLINAAHTVLRGKPGSHLKAWENFTKSIIQLIDYHRKDEIIWLLMGKDAANFQSLIQFGSVIVTGHPSPLNRVHPFVGSNAFIKIDKFLKSKNQKIIW